jgi:transposase
MWLGGKTPRDEAFCATVREICDLYTKRLAPDEMVLCLDEKTSLQPRPRKKPTKPAKPEKPVHVEHEYRRKRQMELIAFLDYLEGVIPSNIIKVHIIYDSLRVHKGKLVMQRLKKHPRFLFHFTRVHCSWMNQVEQWFSILQRKRLKIANFASIDDLRVKLYQYIELWNQTAHPFKWTTKCEAKIMAYAETLKAAA